MLAVGMVAIGCAPVAVLNTEPTHGGACKDGDQLGTMCQDHVTCCPAGYTCDAPHGCLAEEPGPRFGESRDAGR